MGPPLSFEVPRCPLQTLSWRQDLTLSASYVPEPQLSSSEESGAWYIYSHLEGSERSSGLPGWLLSGGPGVHPLPMTLAPDLPALGDTCPGRSPRCPCTWPLSGS